MGAFRQFRQLAAATLAVAVAAAGAFSQDGKRKQPDSDLAVAKDRAVYADAGFTTIQAAVNAATPGQVIEILDTAVYAEQVTVDGRDTSPWTGVTGGKNGITIRYVPPAGTAPNSNFARPTIRWRDTQNTSPKTMAETQVSGELPGMSGNWETNGALRVLSAQGVVIDGIAVDGVSAYPFGAANVWCNGTGGMCSSLFHGSAAITVVKSGGAIIRNCDIKNAYFGILVKDRNTGGVFANPNPDDIDLTIPLSGFGKTGNHLFEYNRIHNNSVGMFFESMWDLGSTVRYNLIYNNSHTSATSTAITIDKNDQNAGAFLFKDMYLSPVAIYNNTLYNNTGNFLGNWQIGGQHLIFNNIFSKSTPESNPSAYMVIDNMFPNRMHNSVFSANGLSGSIDVITASIYNCAANADAAPGGSFINGVRIHRFGPVQGTSTSLTVCDSNKTRNMTILSPGALITKNEGGINLDPPASANLRWLQTEGYTGTGTNSAFSLPVLFKSVVETSPDFLVPKWDHPDVIEFIKNKGWTDVGIKNADGTNADLGAIPSDGKRHPTLARIKPSNIVLINGTNADANFYLAHHSGTFNSPKIKFLRWVSPIPDNTDKWANDWTVIPAASIRAVTASNSVKIGNNSGIRFAVPATTSQYGFFEIVAEGTDANGNLVSSDVGFLPYRQLDYSLKIEFLGEDGRVVNEVTAGDPVRMRVTAQNGTGASVTPFSTGPLNNVTYSLQSASDAFLYRHGTDNTLTEDINVPTPSKTYEVEFRKAGEESVIASGVFTSTSGAQNLVFLGSASIKVLDVAKLTYTASANGAVFGPTVQNIEHGASGETVVAVPDPGYSFIMWSDGLKTAERTDVNVTSHISVTAIFAAEGSRVLLYVAGEGGSINGITTQIVASGASGTPVEAAPNPGYVFVSWSDGSKQAVRTDGNITSDVAFTAEFAKLHYLSYTASPHGTILGSREQTVIAGSSGTTVVAIADAGYRFEGWSDGVTTAERTDAGVNADISVTAMFGEYKYVLSYGASAEHGRILISGGSVQVFTERVDPGADGPQVMAMGSEGYTFLRWSDGSTDALRQDLAVDRDIIVLAHFVDANGNISVASNDRVIPPAPNAETAVVAPVSVLAGEFTAGPNPVGKSSGNIAFFWQGKRIKNGSLSVYDVSGNVVSKIAVKDTAVAGNTGKRAVGSWDLRDGKGRRVSEGTYLVKGKITAADGKGERVSVIVGVR